MELKVENNTVNEGQFCVFQKGTNYYYADRAYVDDYMCIETMIFPANKNGYVEEWIEVYCDRSGKSLEECIHEFLNE